MTQTISSSTQSLPMITLKTSLADEGVAPKKKAFSVLTEITKHNAEQVFGVLEAGCNLGYHFWAVCPDSENHQHCRDLAERFPEQFEWEEKMEAKLFKKVDLYFSAELPNEAAQKELVAHGVIPMVPAEGMIINFDPENESGNGFTFEPGSKWHMIEALIRARETKKFSYDWRNIRQNLKKTTF